MARAETDRENAELDRRQLEAERDWRRLPDARRGFAADQGRVAHQDWQAALRRQEGRRGRVEGSDFGIEYEVAHPDGRKVRYDYVDLRAHRIVDLKPAVEGERVVKVAADNNQQRQRHIDAYKAKFGVEPEYHYAFHPSTRALFGADQRSPLRSEASRASERPEPTLTPDQRSARTERNVLHPKREATAHKADASDRQGGRESKPGRREDERKS